MSRWPPHSARGVDVVHRGPISLSQLPTVDAVSLQSHHPGCNRLSQHCKCDSVQSSVGRRARSGVGWPHCATCRPRALTNQYATINTLLHTRPPPPPRTPHTLVSHLSQVLHARSVHIRFNQLIKRPHSIHHPSIPRHSCNPPHLDPHPRRQLPLKSRLIVAYCLLCVHPVEQPGSSYGFPVTLRYERTECE